MAKGKKSKSEPQVGSLDTSPGDTPSARELESPEPRRKKKRKVARVQDAEEGDVEVVECQPDERGEEEEEELTPEEKRRIERKQKKERKKEEKRLLREAGLPVPKKEKPEKPLALDLALQYLTRWATDHKEWRFQKTRQTWLLQNMYDGSKVPAKYFDQLLEYLDGLKGNARQVTVQKAEALMKDSETTEEPSEDLVTKCRRARQVLQQLS